MKWSPERKINELSAVVELYLPSHVPVHVQLPQNDNRDY